PPGNYDAPFSIDAFRRVRPPTSIEVLQELKNIAYACVNINAQACASYPPRLYVRTGKGHPEPRCLTKQLPRAHPLVVKAQGFERVEQVLEHPLLLLLEKVNPTHNAQDLWELTTLYQEVHGSAYWLLETNALGVPVGIWPLPSHRVTPRRA